MKRILIVLVLLAGMGGFGGWYLYSADNRTTTFKTVQVERGDLLATISATGTIEPEDIIDVGAQVQGQILSFGQDPRGHKPIDFKSPVEKGTVLARIDEKLYKAQVDRAETQLAQARGQIESAEALVESAKGQVESSEALVAQAEANLQKVEADLGQMRAKLVQTDREYARARVLVQTRAVNQSDCDLAEANYETARATLACGEATIAQTKAALRDAHANVTKSKAALKDSYANVTKSKATEKDMLAALENANINLGYCTIKSPVKGVIIDRRVNVGQTVVSSLNAPSLFLIAKDLKRLQVWASVNEADIGNIRENQAATFTVDAFPNRVFKGTVAPDNPRLNASMTNNVVIYTVVVTIDNSDGTLSPYLTANLRFEVDRHSHVLMVPNAALRWRPNPQLVIPKLRAEYARSLRNKKTPPSDSPGPTSAGEKEPRHQGTLWVQEGKFLRPVKVQIGLTDGLVTEIETSELQEADPVVIGESRATANASANNPFAPKMFGK